MIADGTLADVPGIGETMHAKIVQLATTGQLPAYDKLREAMPSGIGPTQGAWSRPQEDQGPARRLKIESLADLRAAAQAGAIARQKGFGAKTEANILEGLAFLEKTGGRILLNEALLLVTPIFEAVRQHTRVIRAEICGSLSRRAETIGDLDILFSAEDPAPVLKDFVGLPQVARYWLMARPRRASSCRGSSRTSTSNAICGEWRIASFPSRCTTSRDRKRTTSPSQAGAGPGTES